jgi:hypothetical protein
MLHIIFQLLTGNVIKIYSMNLSSQPKCKLEQATRELKLTAAIPVVKASGTATSLALKHVPHRIPLRNSLS